MTKHNPETFRIFTAFDLPLSMNEELYGVAKRIMGKETGVKCTNPRNIHVTLHFFAELERDRVEALLATCQTVLDGERSFTVRIRGVGSFPNNRAPRIIWAGISEGADRIAEIKHALDKALTPQGFGIEKRAFVSHLTIARVKFCHDQRGLQQRLESESAFSLQETVINELHVIKSTLTQDGPVYEILRSFPLI